MEKRERQKDEGRESPEGKRNQKNKSLIRND